MAEEQSKKGFKLDLNGDGKDDRQQVFGMAKNVFWSIVVVIAFLVLCSCCGWLTVGMYMFNS